MYTGFNRLGRFSSTAAAVALALAATSAWSADKDPELTGAQEVPPVKTSASGEQSIKISDDGAVSGKVMTKGVEGTMAHIHTGAAGTNGPVIIPLTKGDGGAWMVPAGAKLTDDQMKAYKDSGLYVNVHSEAHKGGEIRDQLEP